MARVLIAPGALRDLERMVETHSLPADTWMRVERALRPLAAFPLLGPALRGRWAPQRFVLGPWRWMVIVYRWEETRDLVAVTAIIDGRSSSAPRHSQ